MRKELKYLLYTVTILGFIIFTGSYYFSEKNKKLSYRSTKLYDGNILKYSNNLIILESNTENIIEYVENNVGQNKKTYHFWKLLINDKK